MGHPGSICISLESQRVRRCGGSSMCDTVIYTICALSEMPLAVHLLLPYWLNKNEKVTKQ